MRTRTKDQKYQYKQLASFWTPNGETEVFKKPFRHFLNKDGSVEVDWLNVRKGDERSNLALSVMLDFCQDNGIEFRFDRLKDLEDGERLAKYTGRQGPVRRWNRNYMWPDTYVLRILIPGGTPKRHKPVRLNPKMSEEL